MPSYYVNLVCIQSFIFSMLQSALLQCRYFDAHGNYYLKDNEVVQDTWLEGVDWNKV